MIDITIIANIPTTTIMFIPAFGNFILATVLSFPILLLPLSRTVTLQVAVCSPSLVVAVIVAVPEDLHWLLNIANSISGLDLIPVPRNASYTNNPGETAVSSEYLRNEIEYYAQQIPDANTSVNNSATTSE